MVTCPYCRRVKGEEKARRLWWVQWSEDAAGEFSHGTLCRTQREADALKERLRLPGVFNISVTREAADGEDV